MDGPNVSDFAQIKLQSVMGYLGFSQTSNSTFFFLLSLKYDLNSSIR